MTAMTTFPNHRQIYMTKEEGYNWGVGKAGVRGCKAGVSPAIKDKRKRKNERDKERRKSTGTKIELFWEATMKSRGKKVREGYNRFRRQ